MNWRTWVAAAAAAVALCAAWPAAAQTFPARSITLVVPYPPGGGVDSMARVAADKLAAALGQPVVVENRGGAGGNIGTRFVAKSKPDGYTLLLGHTGSISINPSLYANAGYDPRKDFAPVGLMASMPVALLAHPSFSAKTVTDVIAYAKANPGKLNVGTSSIGTGGYMSAELFKATTGIDVAIVPYKGTAPLGTCRSRSACCHRRSAICRPAPCGRSRC
jgi:tripartite-type tricarboxylate transporter receptor subunit TctC